MVKIEKDKLLELVQKKLVAMPAKFEQAGAGAKAAKEMSTTEVIAAVREACSELGEIEKSTQCCLPRFVDEYAGTEYVHMQGLHQDRWVEGHIKVGEVRDMCLTRCTARKKPVGWLSESLKQISCLIEDVLASGHKPEKLVKARDLLRGAEDYAERIHKFETDLENQHLTR